MMMMDLMKTRSQAACCALQTLGKTLAKETPEVIVMNHQMMMMSIIMKLIHINLGNDDISEFSTRTPGD